MYGKIGKKAKKMIMYDEWKSRRAEENSHYVIKNRFEMNLYGKLYIVGVEAADGEWKTLFSVEKTKNKTKQNIKNGEKNRK